MIKLYNQIPLKFRGICLDYKPFMQESKAYELTLYTKK